MTKKISKHNLTHNLKLSPKDDENLYLSYTGSKIDANPYLKESLSPQRSGIFERQKIKPYSKATL